ncbi:MULTISPECIES: hypothetical protein [unclassified Pseudomonas]|uniref:hypothetical protein n=1 Tax=unclassified Pseudomonas TaxID=196821 RepID=UPI001C60D089|nr:MULTISPECIES: hypothetical protein [unclassified Pseudomonas]MBW5416133.1 hypothetical protein [Pseudomonas sp. MAG002Y]
MTSQEEFEQWIIEAESKPLRKLGLKGETLERLIRDIWLRKDERGRYVAPRTIERWADWRASRDYIKIMVPSYEDVNTLGGREVRTLFLASLKEAGLKVKL